jgi:nicotinamidase-related amidase
VAASVDDMLAQLPPQRLQRTLLLRDCMSPVSGFEAAAEAFLQRARAAGLQTVALAALA